MKIAPRLLFATLIAIALLLIPFSVGVATIASTAGPAAAAGIVLALFTLPTLLSTRVFGAYPNKLIVEGLRDSFMADPDGAALSPWLRCKLVADAATPDGTPVLQLASASERGSVVTMQPIAVGAYGNCAYSNGSGGTLMGVCVGGIPHGDPVYAAASGKVAASGTVLLGVATCAGFDGGTVTYLPNPAAA